MTLFIIMVTITSLKDRTVAEQEERRKLVSELEDRLRTIEEMAMVNGY